MIDIICLSQTLCPLSKSISLNEDRCGPRVCFHGPSITADSVGGGGCARARGLKRSQVVTRKRKCKTEIDLENEEEKKNIVPLCFFISKATLIQGRKPVGVLSQRHTGNRLVQTGSQQQHNNNKVHTVLQQCLPILIRKQYTECILQHTSRRRNYRQVQLTRTTLALTPAYPTSFWVWLSPCLHVNEVR